ncbi:vacuolar protein [Kwoniella heveanensis BCC8398]|uniref:Vacuolar protein n=1 Tax=Kwoniella heveanensis BCC8398 TaxID=1296120 RepID=A0A1B9H1M1_9TREE|nr:vacuolar protein [Kwoniella heveanensis BCC8398]
MRADVTLGAVLVAAAAAVTAAESQQALPVPTRPLEWKDVNFLSTSDVHGWLLGHQHNYSGDFGSFASFATHMRSIASSKRVDLLLIDAGDHHDGSGLVSSSPTAAGDSETIFSMLPFDVLTIGNHELYHYDDALEAYRNVGRWGGRYVTSNVNISIQANDGSWQSVPIGEQYLKFKTEQGRHVTAFGVIFDCKLSWRTAGVSVQKPSKLAKEQWFINAIQEAPDYFVLAGHMPVRGETSEWTAIYDAIRAVHPYVPIYLFGGHTHVRDCIQYDDRSIGVVPGCYLETVAFTSSSLPANESDIAPLDVSRRYLDANPVTYKWHTNTSDDFDLPIGQNITKALVKLASDLDISTPLGIAPHSYFLNRHQWGHKRSVLTLFSDEVLPYTVRDKERNGTRVIIGNAGSLRFDLFQGTFDRNDELTVSPFTSAFLYVSLPAGLARNITEQMNRSGASKLVPSPSTSTSPSQLYTKAEEEARVRRLHDEWVAEQWQDYLSQSGSDGMTLSGSLDQVVFGVHDKPRTLGLVTKDKCPGRGDDIEHIPVPFTPNQPDFIESPFPDVDDGEVIDVVCMDFSLDDFLAAVNVLDPTIGLKESHMKPYAEGLQINTVFGMYAKHKWSKGL